MLCNSRTATVEINELFLKRQSISSFAEATISQEQLLALFEAARWAPSSKNNQPTRFIYAHRNTPGWQRLFAILKPSNQARTINSAVLVVVISKKTMDDHSASHTNSFEAGAAWMSLALQAHMNGLAVLGMAGLDYEKARVDLAIPDGYHVEMMSAIGKRTIEGVDQKFLDRDANPTIRKPLSELISQDIFRFNE